MMLQTLLDEYLDVRPGLAPFYVGSLKASLRRFSESVGHPARVCELTGPTIGLHLSAYHKYVAASTVNGELRRLLTLSHYAVETGRLDKMPLGLRRLREVREVPQAFGLAEVARIVAACELQPGELDGVPAAAWWKSLILTLYWTGCRVGSILACAPSDFKDGGLMARRMKNREAQFFALPATCRDAIGAILTNPPHEKLWAWPWHRRTLWNHFRIILDRAGIHPPYTHCMLFHSLRR